MFSRALAVLAVFLVFGYGTAHLLIARAVSRGAPEYSVRLGGAVGGLFVGGAAATLLTLTLMLGSKRSHAETDETGEERRNP